MSLRLFIRLQQDVRRGTWRAHVPAIEDLSVEAETRESALTRVRRAIEGYLENARDCGDALPSGDDTTEWAELVVAVP